MFSCKIKFQLILLLGLLFIFQLAKSQHSVDSLLNVLTESQSKAEILNLLAEATLEDSLEMSMKYAEQAWEQAFIENNGREQGLAQFGMGEVFALQYELDSAVNHYENALKTLKEVGDNYYVSYTLNKLGRINNIFGKYQKAIDCYFESLQYIDMDEHLDDLAHVYIDIGNAFHNLGKYHTAIKYFHKSTSILASLEDQSALSTAYNGIGLAYKLLGTFDSAIYYYNSMLDIDKKTGSLRDQAVDYENIGALYAEWKKIEQSYSFYQKALELYLVEGSNRDLSVAYNNLCKIHIAKKQYDSALYYFNSASEIEWEIGIEQFMAARYNNLGDVYYELKKYSQALSYYNKALEINQKTGERHCIALNLVNIARVKFKLGDPIEAEQYFFKGLKIAKEIKSQKLVKDILDDISDFYTEQNLYGKTMLFHQQTAQLHDSLFKKQTLQTLADIQTKYELDKKTKEISILQKDKEFQSMLVKSYRSSNYYLIGGIVLFSIILVLLYFQYRSKHHGYNKLVEKNMELIKAQKLKEQKVNNNSSRTNNLTNSSESKNQQELYEILLAYMKNERPFLESDLTVKKMAKKLQTNTHYISEVINQKFGYNFNQFINEYRVNEACKLLSNHNNNHFTIESIAQQSGFKSKSAFNNAFKSITGVTPSYYKKIASIFLSV